MPQAKCYLNGIELGKKGLHASKKQTLGGWTKHLRKAFNKELVASGAPSQEEAWQIQRHMIAPDELKLSYTNGYAFWVDRKANALATN